MSDEGTHARRTCLVCFAVPHEAKFFSIPTGLTTRVEILVTGIGRHNALRATEQALARARPDLVLSCGFAGALNPELAVGTLLFAEDESLGLAPILLELGAVPGMFLCAPRVAVTAAEKRELWETTRADAVEMESGVIRELCQSRRVPSAMLRVISDCAGEDLPLDFNAMMTPGQQLHYGKMALALGKAPGRLAGLCRLHRQTRQAAQKLGQALVELLRRDAIPARVQER